LIILKNQKVLIVEDEWILAFDLKVRLSFHDFHDIKIVSSGEQAIESVKTFKPVGRINSMCAKLS
jgi:hypothetical protein